MLCFRSRGNEVLKQEIYDFIVKMYPICRSLTGNGVRETLAYINTLLPLEIHEVPSGTKVYDWEVPDEWNILEAYIEDEAGNRIIDMAINNLHVVSYSVPIDDWFDLEELKSHIYTDEKLPDAIPYITSYYKRIWGFCMSHNQKQSLKPGKYHAVIKSELKPGHLTYGECIIPGRSSYEVLISTYVCHPSMANNELSGPALTTYLGRWLKEKDRKYTYRLIFIPETIGALVYIKNNINHLKENTIASINISCVGDNNHYSYVPTRYGDTFSDRVAKTVLRHAVGEYKTYSYLDRGSNERMFCSPGVDLPMVNITRSKFNDYKEYHTSLDNLDFVSPDGLGGSFDVYTKFIELIENNACYESVYIGEPQLGKRNMYDYNGVAGRKLSNNTKIIKDFLIYSDGTNDLIDISELTGIPPWDMYDVIKVLLENNLIKGPTRKLARRRGISD